jgi:hypothetical protein
LIHAKDNSQGIQHAHSDATPFKDETVEVFLDPTLRCRRVQIADAERRPAEIRFSSRAFRMISMK